jgi:DNA-binding NarL/FixJ family response regulator
MNEVTLEHRTPRATVPPVDPGGRLLDLLSSFSVLRSDEHLLINQIRSSLNEMRKLRSQLRSQRAAIFQPSTNGKKDPGITLMHRYGLTRREAQVAALLAQGWPNLEIAEELEISAHTARHHTQRVLSKLNVHSRAAAGARIRG